MKALFIGMTSCIAIALLVATTNCRNKTEAPDVIKNNPKGFVVMELFTSQSCSSCPHADDLLGSYAQQNNDHIIPLAFHVDYWNLLGWKDSFSNAEYSQRQEYYNEKFLHADVYTPQLVVNGNKEMVGNNDIKVKAAVENALAETSTASIDFTYQPISNRQLQIQYTINGNTTSTMLNTVVIQYKTITKIKGGENGGVTLTNYNVVRSFVHSPAENSGTSFIKLPAGIDTKELSIVLYTQDTTTGKITGAIKKEL
jgi:hypothetical protein